MPAGVLREEPEKIFIATKQENTQQGQIASVQCRIMILFIAGNVPVPASGRNKTPTALNPNHQGRSKNRQENALCARKNCQ